MKPKAAHQVRDATLSGVLAIVLLGSTVVAMAAVPTPRPVADVNCDGRGTAADFCAAVIVSGDETQFPACAAADPFRGQPLTDQDFLPILHDLFDTFAAPWTPTATASPTITPDATVTATPTPTLQAQASPTPSATASPSATPTPTKTATETPTPLPTFRPTSSPTRSTTPTAVPTPTRTPTGVAFQLSGDWYAAWTGQICYLNGQPSGQLTPTIYPVTALQGQLDMQIAGGAYIGRGLVLDANNTVQTIYTVSDPNNVCYNGVHQEYVFDYTFTFATNGTGTAAVHWSYGLNTNCAQCIVDDTALLTRIAGPGS